MAYRHPNSFNARASSGGTNGGLGGAQPQSQYFQSFDASHLTQPLPNRRHVYTAEQKDTAIRLLNEGNPAKTIVGQIGGTCSKSNPYRWRAEAQERERRAEEERQELQELARQRRMRQHHAQINVAIHDNLLPLFICALAEIIGFIWAFGTFITLFWILWRICIRVGFGFQILNFNMVIRLLYVSVIILWICVIYNIGTAPLLVRSDHFPYIAFNW